MKIAVLGFGAGGSVHYAAQLANGIAEYERVVFITHTPSVSALCSNKVQVVASRGPRRRGGLVSWYRELCGLVQAAEPDFILDAVGTCNGWTAPLGLWRSIRPLAVTVHEPQAPIDYNTTFRITYRFVNALRFKTASILLVHGQESRRKLLATGVPSGKVHVIPHVAYNCLNPQRTWMESDARTILFFGSMRYNKGVDRLADIAREVRKSVPDAKFLVVGSPVRQTFWSDRTKTQVVLKAIRRLKCLQGEGFEVHDRFVPDTQVEYYFRRASVVILPYYDAAQSGVAALALSFGKPVVATRVGDLPDLVYDGTTGLLADPQSVSDIADKVIRLLTDDDLRHQMASNALYEAGSRLSPESVGSQVIELLWRFTS